MDFAHFYILAVMGTSYFHGEDPGYLNIYISGYGQTSFIVDLPWEPEPLNKILSGRNDSWQNSYVLTEKQRDMAVSKGVRVWADNMLSIQVSRGKVDITNQAAYTALPISPVSKEFILSSVPNSAENALFNANPFYMIGTGERAANITIRKHNRDGTEMILSQEIPAYTVLQKVSTSDDVTGLHVYSSSPVAVYSGHQCGNIPTNTRYCEPLLQQVMPVEELGTEYITGPIADRDQYTLRMISTSPDSKFLVTSQQMISLPTDKCSSNECTLDPGEHLDIITSGICSVSCSTKCYVYQMNHGGAENDVVHSDPFMMSVLPVSSAGSTYSFSTISSYQFGKLRPYRNYINIIARATAQVILDSVLLTEKSRLDPWILFQKEIQPGHHFVWARNSTISSQTLIVQVYGHGMREQPGYTGYGYPVIDSVVKGDMPDFEITIKEEKPASMATTTNSEETEPDRSMTREVKSLAAQSNPSDNLIQALMLFVLVITLFQC